VAGLWRIAGTGSGGPGGGADPGAVPAGGKVHHVALGCLLRREGHGNGGYAEHGGRCAGPASE